MPDAQTMLMALQKGEIDLIFGSDGDQITSDTFAKLQKEGQYAVLASDPIASPRRAPQFKSEKRPRHR